MNKLLILFVALFSLVGTMPGNAASSQSTFGAQQRKNRNIMDLPIFERLVIIVKHYETLHNGLTTWPYVGYGHMKLPGEKYYKGYKMSEREADALLRKDLRKFCELYEKYGKDKYLLGALAYNCGPGVVNESSVLRLLKSGNRNIYKEYTSHCHYKGKWHKQLHERRKMEYNLLFKP